MRQSSEAIAYSVNDEDFNSDLFIMPVDLHPAVPRVLGNVPPSTLVDCTSAVPRLVREGDLGTALESFAAH